jgi:hypothetical protein
MIVAVQSIEDLLSLYIIGESSDPEILTVCLRLALWNTFGEKFGHFAPLTGFDRSIRIFGQEPFENSVPLPQPLSPHGLAHELARLARTEARYPARTEAGTAFASKGWTILTIDEKDAKGNPLVVAYATWLP